MTICQNKYLSRFLTLRRISLWEKYPMTEYSNNENNIYNTGCHKMSNRHFLFYKYIAFFVSQQMLSQLSWSKKKSALQTCDLLQRKNEYNG